jgi:hypothetical protein
MKRKTANIDIRVEPQLIEKIDAWRAQQRVLLLVGISTGNTEISSLPKSCGNKARLEREWPLAAGVCLCGGRLQSLDEAPKPGKRPNHGT